jgi:flagellar biosynthesis/type III secretory pathway M-ring protein FliF/YscJ
MLWWSVQKGKVTPYTRRKRSQEELDKIQQLAEAVIGFDAKRGDSISVENMSFDAEIAAERICRSDDVDEQGAGKDGFGLFVDAPPGFFLVLFLLAYMFVLRPFRNKC